MKLIGGDQVEGRRSVIELLAAGRRRVKVVWLAEGMDERTAAADGITQRTKKSLS